MSMYLPNPDLQPTGFEPAEFIDIPTTVEEDHPMDTHRRQSGPAYLRGMLVSSWTDATMHRRPLSDQTRVNITRRAEEYIAGLVRDHHGDSEDVRSVIHDLHLQCTLSHDQESPDLPPPAAVIDEADTVSDPTGKRELAATGRGTGRDGAGAWPRHDVGPGFRRDG